MYEEATARKDRPIHDRVLSFVLALTMVLSCIVVGIPNFSLRAKAAGDDGNKGTLKFKDADIDYDSNLVANPDGTFTLSLDFSSSIKRADQNVSRTVSGDGYYVAPMSGYYTIQLWGGDGGVGSDTTFNDGGKAGKGGYVYTAVKLEKGDILAYRLGGNGTQTLKTEDGGGVNGDGGNHGEYGSYYIGGGGGYSIVYLYKNGTAANNFVANFTSNGEILPITSSNKAAYETERMDASKYILVAGGGGGGGAGDRLNAQQVLDLVFNKPNGNADGGAGGTLTSASYTTSTGIIYAGQDGKSSGKNTAYIGHGGTNVPGKAPEGRAGIIEADDPNDWTKTVIKDAEGGTGSSGNLRGGGGGAGYTGGSGGIMQSLVNSTNVGGGGGGSSYVATNNAALVGLAGAGLTSDEQTAIASATNPRAKNSDGTQGGYVKIDLLDKDTEDTNIKWIDTDLKLDATISKYFTVATKSTENATVTLDGNNVSISNLLLSTKGSAKVELTLKPITGFAGGNDVNLFTSDDEFKITAPTGQNAPNVLNLGDTHSYVNIPIDGYSIKVNSPATFESGVPISIDPADLIDSSTVKNIASPNSDFVTEYTYTVNGDAPATITAKGTYTYSFTVTPKTETPANATVGTTAVAQTYSATAIVSQKSSIILNGKGYEGTENLKYNDDGTYTYTYTLTSSELATFTQSTSEAYYNSMTILSNTSYPVSVDGWYQISAWGGDGQKGQSIRFKPSMAGEKIGEGGYGQTGGFASSVVYLKNGDIVDIVTGVGYTGPLSQKDITDAAHNQTITGELGSAKGGSGGGSSFITVNSNRIIYAAGGAGGGGGALYRNKPSASPEECDGGFSTQGAVGTTFDTVPKTFSSDIAASGEDGVATSWDDKRGGKCGTEKSGGYSLTNWIDESSITALNNRSLSTKPSADNVSRPVSGNGSVIIKPMVSMLSESDAKEQIKNDINNITLLDDKLSNLEISSYFTSGDFDTTVKLGEDYVTSTGTKNIGGNDYEFTTYSATVSKTWSVTFEPKTTFLGGFDVPIFDAKSLKLQFGAGGKGNIADVPQTVAAEYANVRLVNPTTVTTTYAEATPYAIAYGANVAENTLFSITKSPSDYDDTFVNYTEEKFSTNASELSCNIYEDESFTYRYSAEYKNAAPSLATVGPVDSAIVSEATAFVKVATYAVSTSLTNLTSNAPSTIAAGNDVDFTITPASGYVLPDSIKYPDSIKVYVGGKEISSAQYVYDKETGDVTIPASLINANVSIEASGVKFEPKEYDFHLVWTYIDKTTNKTVQGDETFKFTSGTTFDSQTDIKNKMSEVEAQVASMTGYEFIWDWPDGSAPTTMPGQNFWLFGQLEPYTYELQVVSAFADGKDSIIDTEKVWYKSSGTIVAPTYDGYVLDSTSNSTTYKIDDTFVSAHPTNGDIIANYVTFNYKVPVNEFTLVTIVDGETISSETKTVGATVTPEDKTGYNLTIDVNGTVVESLDSEGIKNGDVVTLTYTPKQWTVEMWDVDANESLGTITVEYGGYYYGLKTKDGYTGTWYYDESCENAIHVNASEFTKDEYAKGTVDPDVTKVYVKWAGNSFTVNYDANGGTLVDDTPASVSVVYEDGTLAYDDTKVTNTGYVIGKWNVTDSKGQDLGSVTKGADISKLTTKSGEVLTLKAVWMPDTVVSAKHGDNQTYVSEAWVKDNVTITVSNGLNYGLDTVTYYYSTDGGTNWTELKNGSDPTNQLTVTAEGSTTYTFKTVMNAADGTEFDTESITVNIDKTGPNASFYDGVVAVGKTPDAANKWWRAVVNEVVTFVAELFKNDKFTVTVFTDDIVTGKDTSGVVEVKYFIEQVTGDTPSYKTVSDLQAADAWASATTVTSDMDKFTFDIPKGDEESQYVAYAMVTDLAGNVTYISSTGVEFDTTKPEISVAGVDSSDATKVSDGGAAFADRVLTVTDKNLDKVTVVVKDKDGKQVSSSTYNASSDTYTQSLTNEKLTYEITAVDKAGNTTETFTITLNPVDDFIDALDDDWVDKDNPTKDELEEAIKDIDKFVEDETGNDDDSVIDDNITKEEQEELQEKKDELLEELIDDYIADNKITATVPESSDVVILPDDIASIEEVLLDQATTKDAEAVLNGATVDYSITFVTATTPDANATAISTAKLDEIKSVEVKITRTVTPATGDPKTTDVTELKTSTGSIDFGVSLGDYTKADRTYSTYNGGAVASNANVARTETPYVVNITGAGLTPYTFAYAPDTKISGTVKDNEGYPVNGAVVELLDKDGNSFSPKKTVTTGADGAYAFENLPDGDYKVNVTYPVNTGETSVTETEEVTIAPAGTDKTVDVKSDDYNTVGAITGTVTDKNGDPVQGATVELLDKDGNSFEPAKTTTTGTDGTYTFEDIHDGEYKIKVTPKSGDDDAKTTDVLSKLNNDVDPSTDVELGIDAYSDINGIVTDKAGDGVANATVTLVDKDGNPVKDNEGNVIEAVTTDADGKYTFADVPDGEYKVVITAPYAQNDQTNPDTATIEGVKVSDGTVTPDEKNNKTGATGADTFVDGGQLANFETVDTFIDELDDDWVDTSDPADGTLDPTVDQLKEDIKSIEDFLDDNGDNLTDAEKKQLEDKLAELQDMLNKETASDLAGSVVDKNGKPVAGATVTLKNADGTAAKDKDGNAITAVKTDADGNYVFKNVPEGDYIVEVSITKTSNPEDGNVTGTVGTSTAPIKKVDDKITTYDKNEDNKVDALTLSNYQATTDVKGLVLDKNGDPVENAEVALLDKSGNPVEDSSGNPITVKTNANGEYTFEDVPDGSYQIEVTAPYDNNNGQGTNETITIGDVSVKNGVVKPDTVNNKTGAGKADGYVDGTKFETFENDDTDPVITVSPNEPSATNKVYADRTVKVTDDNLTKVIIKKVTPATETTPSEEKTNEYTSFTTPGEFTKTLDNDGSTYTITAIDAEGNETVVTFTLNTVDDFIEDLDDGWTDSSNPTEDELEEAVSAIDKMLEDEDKNLTDDEKKALEEKRSDLIDDLKTSTLSDLKDAYDEAVANEKAINSPNGNSDELAKLKDAYNAAVTVINDDATTSSKAIDDAEKAATDAFTNDNAQSFVNTYASNESNVPYDTTTTEDGNGVNSKNADQIISGETPYGTITNGNDALKDAISKIIADDGEDNFASYDEMLDAAKKVVTDDKAAAKTKLEEDAAKAIADVKDGKKDEDLTESEEQLIQDIKDALKTATDELAKDTTDTEKEINDIVNGAENAFKSATDNDAANDFIEKYASNNNDKDPYDKTESNGVTLENADQILAGATDPDGEGDGKSPYDSLTPDQQKLVNEKIATPTSDPAEGTYEDYLAMVEAAKKAVADDKAAAKTKLEEDAAKAIADVKDGKKDEDLTESEEQLIQDIKDALKTATDELAKDTTDTEKEINNIVNGAENAFKSATDNDAANDFIEKYASNNNDKDPYDKTESNGVTSDNADQILAGATDPDGEGDGKSPYDSLTPDQQKLVNEKIATPTSDPAEGTYEDYPAMVEAAKGVVAEEKTDAKSELESYAEETKKAIDALVSEGGLTKEEATTLKNDVDKVLTEALAELEDASVDTVSEIEDIVDDAKDLMDLDIGKAAAINEIEKAYTETKDAIETFDSKDDKGYIAEARGEADDAIKAIIDTPLDKIGDLDDIEEKAIDNFIEDTAKAFVKTYASGNDNDPYDKKDDPVTKENTDQILSGDDIFENLTDRVQEKIDEIINTPTADETGYTAGTDTYPTYKDMVAAAEVVLADEKQNAKDAIDDAANKAIEDVKKLQEPNGNLTEDEVKEIIDEIKKAADDAKKAIDDAKTTDDVTSAKEDGIENIEAIDELSQKADEAIQDIKDMYGDDADKAPASDLINDIKETLSDAIDDINDPANTDTTEDIVAAAEDDFDDAVAQAFVDKYASGSDNDPYDKTDDKLNLDNIKQVVSGKDVYSSLPDSVKDKIDSIISTPTGSETTYPSYSDMLLDAQTIANNISDDNDIRVDVKVDGLMLFDNGNATSVSDIKNILVQSIDSDDIDVMLAGGRVSIVMTIKEIADDELNSNAISADGLKLYKHVEITIVKTQYDSNDKVIGSENITKTAEPISFVVSVADIQKDGRVFYVYADHTGKTKAEKTADGDGVLLSSTVEFETSDFSVFSIAYVDDSPIEEIVNTLDESPIITMFATFGLSALMFVATKKKKDSLEDETN